MSEPLERAVFRSCLECGAGVGETHWPGCTRRAGGGDDDLMVAIGTCRERGWAAVHVEGEGFRPCEPADPGAYVDLDRYASWIGHGSELLDGNEP